MLKNCIIGYSGLVGQYLNKENSDLYNSKNINEAKYKIYDTVYIAAPNADKWIINKNPENDKVNILSILDVLKTIIFNKVILFSSIDIYDNLEEHDENYNSSPKHYYGKNRLFFENEISLYDNHCIIRLPGLFCDKLKKNIIYDICNKNFYKKFNYFDEYQWYNLKNLEYDLEKIITNNIKLINITSEPISNKELVDYLNDTNIKQHFVNKMDVKYNIKSIYSDIIHYEKKTILQEIKELYEKN